MTLAKLSAWMAQPAHPRGPRPLRDLALVVLLAVAVASIAARVAHGGRARDPVLSPSFVATPIVSSEAPAAFHFEATATVDRAFHAVTYDWHFGDEDQEPWPASGVPRNTDSGPIVGHVYEAPGRYPVRLCAYVDSDHDGAPSAGEPVECAHQLVTVTAPAGLACVSRAGDFAGCPAGARRVTSSGTFEQALAACGTRCAFRRGESWRASAAVRWAGYLATYGDGPRVVVERGAGTWLYAQPGAVVSGFEVMGGAGSSDMISIGDQRSRMVFHDLRLTGLGAGCVIMAGPVGGTHADLVAVSEVECLGRSDARIAGLYFGGDRVLVLGVHVDNAYGGEFNLRTWHLARSAIAHSRFARPSAALTGQRNNMQIRALSHSQGVGSGLPRRATERVVIAHNAFTMDNGSAYGAIRLCQTNDCRNDAGGVAQEVRDLVIERNSFAFSTGSGAARGTHGQGFVWAQGSDLSIRRNVLELTGLETASAAGPIVAACYRPANYTVGGAQLSAQGVACADNEIVLRDATARGVTLCAGVGTGHRCDRNRARLPLVTGSRVEASGAGWTSAGNVFAR